MRARQKISCWLMYGVKGVLAPPVQDYTYLCSWCKQAVSLFAHPLVPSMVSIVLVSMTFSCIPNEDMLLVMVKACVVL